MKQDDSEYVADLRQRLKTNWVLGNAEVEQLLAIIDRMEEERRMQHATIMCYREEVEHLKAESKQVKELIAGNLKQIGELKHYLHERGRDNMSLKSQLRVIKEAFTPRLKELFEGFYVVGNQCTCEGDDYFDGICGPECTHENTCPCIAHEVKRLGCRLAEKLGEVEDE